MLELFQKLLNDGPLAKPNWPLPPAIPQAKAPDQVDLLKLAYISKVFSIVIDTSGSMSHDCCGKTRLDAAVVAIISLLEALHENQANAAVNLISFGSRAKCIMPPTPIKGSIEQHKSAVNSLRISGSTRMDKGLNLSLTQLSLCPHSAQREVILLTDGYANDGSSTREAAEKLKSTGVRISTVGVGYKPSDVDEELLKSMASIEVGKPRYWFISDADQLEQRFRSFAMPIRKL